MGRCKKWSFLLLFTIIILEVNFFAQVKTSFIGKVLYFTDGGL